MQNLCLGVLPRKPALFLRLGGKCLAGRKLEDVTSLLGADTDLANLLKILQIKFKWVKMPHLRHKFRRLQLSAGVSRH